MKFTEREMTVAVDAVAQKLYAGSRPPWRKGSAEDAWAELGKFEKYQHRAAAGEVVLTPLLALPERPTVGATPEFSQEEYRAAAESGGQVESLEGKKRERFIAMTAQLTKYAVEAMPIRQDPDALIVPDHL
ncbi:MAG: hypothetical protein L0H93_13865 [Nocardioides sp.]|nr:hypothetical protein [Nocardioides sp.]